MFIFFLIFLKKIQTLTFLFVMLCFGGKNCFLTEKPKVGNRDQMELNISEQSVIF